MKQHDLVAEKGMVEIHFSTISRLEQYVTDSWTGVGRERTISREDIATFGTLTENEQWIHVDQERCQNESIYGDIIAHGFFILTLIPSLLPPEPFQVVGHAHRIVRGSDSFRFLNPVYPGDTVCARTRLVNVQAASSGKGVILHREIELIVPKRKVTVVTCTLMLQYF